MASVLIAQLREGTFTRSVWHRHRIRRKDIGTGSDICVRDPRYSALDCVVMFDVYEGFRRN